MGGKELLSVSQNFLRESDEGCASYISNECIIAYQKLKGYDQSNPTPPPGHGHVNYNHSFTITTYIYKG
ncbi:hypothetical protein OIU76_015328 [Salix suchowensis]|nr:hypothetical protein OIU76_015328 [Salix suchowensis]